MIPGFLLVLLLSGFTAEVSAQPGPPPWAPAHGYRAKARYTYFPTLSLYFDTKIGVYFFLEHGVWIQRTSLPPGFKGFNWKKHRYEEFEWHNHHPWEKHHGKGHGHAKHKGKGPGKGKGKHH